jgi:hypothetical protein
MRLCRSASIPAAAELDGDWTADARPWRARQDAHHCRGRDHARGQAAAPETARVNAIRRKEVKSSEFLTFIAQLQPLTEGTFSRHDGNGIGIFRGKDRSACV